MLQSRSEFPTFHGTRNFSFLPLDLRFTYEKRAMQWGKNKNNNKSVERARIVSRALFPRPPSPRRKGYSPSPSCEVKRQPVPLSALSMLTRGAFSVLRPRQLRQIFAHRCQSISPTHKTEITFCGVVSTPPVNVLSAFWGINKKVSRSVDSIEGTVEHHRDAIQEVDFRGARPVNHGIQNRSAEFLPARGIVSAL